MTLSLIHISKAIGEKFDKAFGDVLNYETFRSAKNLSLIHICSSTNWGESIG